MTNEKRIQQIKDCAQTIIDKAESICDDYEFVKNMQIVIDVPCKEIPTISVNREFYSKIMLEHL